MSKTIILTAVLLALLLNLSGCAKGPTIDEIAFADVAQKTHSALVPETQKAEWAQSWWMPRHDAVNARVAQGNVDLIIFFCA